MFRSLFRHDGGLMITMGQITDCIFLSLFFFLGCVPVVTAGAAIAALYDAAFQAFRKGERHSWQRFGKTFRESLKPSLIPNLIFLPLFFLWAWAMIGLWNAAVAGSLSWMVFSAAACGAMAVLGILSLLFPMLSRFENSTGALLKNTLLLGLGNLPWALALGIVNTVAVVLCVYYVFPLFFLPALAALLGSLFIEPVFRPYLPAEPEVPEETEESAEEES